MHFIEKRIAVKQAISVLAKNNIQVNEDEASVILDFLYLIAKNYTFHENTEKADLNNKPKQKVKKVHRREI